MAQSAFPLGLTQSVIRRVDQVAHGFIVGDAVRLSGASTYTKAQANSYANSQMVGIVSEVITANRFQITECGYITGLPVKVAATLYYLSPSSAGALTATQPTTAGQVDMPCLITDTTTRGFVIPNVGRLIATVSSLTWNVIAANQTLAVANGYFTNDAGQLSLALPAAMAVGDTIKVVSHSAGGWIITQGAGQIIYDLAGNSTLGAGGSVAATAQGDSIELVCVVANTTMRVVSSKGTLSYI